MRYGATVNGKIPSDFRLRYRLPEIAKQMQAGYDESPRGVTNSASFGPKGQRLRAQIGSLSHYRAIKRGKIDYGWMWSTHHPGARIQDRGGVIPARTVKRAKAMKMIYHGSLRFAKRVGPSRIRAKEYTRRGVENVKRNMGLAVDLQIEWKEHKV